MRPSDETLPGQPSLLSGRRPLTGRPRHCAQERRRHVRRSSGPRCGSGQLHRGRAGLRASLSACKHTKDVAPHNLYSRWRPRAASSASCCWLVFYAGGCFLAIKAIVVSKLLAPGPIQSAGTVLASGVLISLAGWSVASVFLHLEHFRQLLMMMALGASLAYAPMRPPSQHWALRDPSIRRRCRLHAARARALPGGAGAFRRVPSPGGRSLGTGRRRAWWRQCLRVRRDQPHIVLRHTPPSSATGHTSVWWRRRSGSRPGSDGRSRCTSRRLALHAVITVVVTGPRRDLVRTRCDRGSRGGAAVHRFAAFVVRPHSARRDRHDRRAG